MIICDGIIVYIIYVYIIFFLNFESLFLIISRCRSKLRSVFIRVLFDFIELVNLFICLVMVENLNICRVLLNILVY